MQAQTRKRTDWRARARTHTHTHTPEADWSGWDGFGDCGASCDIGRSRTQCRSRPGAEWTWAAKYPKLQLQVHTRDQGMDRGGSDKEMHRKQERLLRRRVSLKKHDSPPLEQGPKPGKRSPEKYSEKQLRFSVLLLKSTNLVVETIISAAFLHTLTRSFPRWASGSHLVWVWSPPAVLASLPERASQRPNSNFVMIYPKAPTPLTYSMERLESSKIPKEYEPSPPIFVCARPRQP